MARTYSNRVRDDLPWDRARRSAVGGAASNPTPPVSTPDTAGQPSQHSSATQSEMTEPVVAERPRHARDESPLSTTSDGVEEDAEGVSLRSRPGSPAGSDKSPVDHDAGLQAILDEQRQKDTRSEDSQEDETEGMEVDTDHQSQDASVGQAAENRQHTDAEKAAIKKEWKRVGRPICTATLPNGEGCGMYHPHQFHDDDLAMQAKETQRSFEMLREMHPHAFKPPLTEQERKVKKLQRRKANKAERKEKEKAQNGQQVTGASNGQAAQPAQPNKKQGQPSGHECPTCNKRHHGECRFCPCGRGWHLRSKCRHNGIPKPSSTPAGGSNPQPPATAASGSNPPAQPTGAATTQQTQLMSREEVLQHLSLNVSSPAGLEILTRLANAGTRAAVRPTTQQQPQNYADAAKNGAKQGG